MKETPILFSTPMVQAILDGRKTQTRRIIKQAIGWDAIWKVVPVGEEHISSKPQFEIRCGSRYHLPTFCCPYGQPGDVLWVRERFCKDFLNRYWYYQQFDFSRKYHYVHDSTINEEIQFKATAFKPSIHMPKAAARIWLQIESIGVERVHQISEEDAKAEGVNTYPHKNSKWYNCYLCETGIGHRGDSHVCGPYGEWRTAIESFHSLWESINGPESWEANPYVWVVKFKVLSTTGKPTHLITQ